MAIREPYQRVEDPQSRLIQIRGIKKHNGASDPLIRMNVPHGVQEFFAKLLNHLGHRSDWFATCVTCLHWQSYADNKGKVSKCSKFDCMPPPEVIADGCEHYEDNDQIPF